MAARPSSIDQLPEEMRALIGELRGLGWTIDQIREKLSELLDQAPSRSALGRHIAGMNKMAERMRRSREVATALVRELGEMPESRTARLNIELMHGAVMDLFMRAGDGEVVDSDGAAALAGNPEGVMMLSKALDHLSRASKTNVEFVAAAEARAATKAKTEAVKAVEAVGRERGISADTVAAIKAGIFGVKPA
jgi:hypothetical protein